MKKIIFMLAVAGLFFACDAKKSTTEAGESTPTASLDGNWELTYVAGTKMEFNNLYPDRKPFMLFNTKESKVSGNTGCNSFTGMLSSLSDGKIRFDESMAMTKMFCPGDGENVFTQQLKQVNSFDISEDGILHLTHDGDDIMRLSKK